jgi:hypothetical protein
VKIDDRIGAPSLTPTKARAFLAPLAAGTATDLALKDVVLLAYGTGGWLMAAFLPDGKKWTEFLDEIEDALESVEEPHQ